MGQIHIRPASTLGRGYLRRNLGRFATVGDGIRDLWLLHQFVDDGIDAHLGQQRHQRLPEAVEVLARVPDVGETQRFGRAEGDAE